MPIFFLFIVTLVFFTFLFPEKILSFLRTIRQWLSLRQAKREALNTRQGVVDEAMLDLVSWVATTQKQLRSQPNSGNREQLLRQLQAAGERYLQTVNQDEQPSIYRFTKEIVRDIEKTRNKSAVRHDAR